MKLNSGGLRHKLCSKRWEATGVGSTCSYCPASHVTCSDVTAVRPTSDSDTDTDGSATDDDEAGADGTESDGVYGHYGQQRNQFRAVLPEPHVLVTTGSSECYDR